MSILIDRLIVQSKDVRAGVNGKWYVAKPIEYFSVGRIKDAWRVLVGKARAYHYKIDED